MPRSESTIASPGPSIQYCIDRSAQDRRCAVLFGQRCRSGVRSDHLSRWKHPLQDLVERLCVLLKDTEAKYVSTAIPKMIGSETFIIVALR